MEPKEGREGWRYPSDLGQRLADAQLLALDAEAYAARCRTAADELLEKAQRLAEANAGRWRLTARPTILETLGIPFPDADSPEPVAPAIPA